MSNKNILLSVAVITMLALSAGLVWANEETSMDASGSIVKWQQPPDMKYGVNIRSTEVDPIVADDWKCEDPRPVTDVHFWGSYIGWEIKNEKPQSLPSGVEIFIIRIYEDVPDRVDPNIPYSHPGKLLYAEKVDKFEERYVGAIPHPDRTYEHKFYYSLDLTEPFEQKEGTIYWISIAAVMQDDEYKYPWGWETSTRHWNDDACRHWYHNDYWEELTPAMMPLWYQEHYKTVDMAFELTVKPYPDLGDAPDTTNSFSTSMTAYPGVKAYFPTVYQAGSPPHGPIHRQPKALAFLGRRVSLESEADIGFDEDGVNNIVPQNDAANLDRADDGLSPPLVLVHCKPNTFEYVVTVVNPMQRSIYANVWFDWNRDGDWDDMMKCPGEGGTVPVPVPEWAVQNQQLQLSGPGVFTFTTPRFMAWLSPVGAVHDGTWMRITLSERRWEPIADVRGSGGSGPAGGYLYGETEDYYVRYIQPPPNAKWVQMPDLTPDGIDIRVDEMRTIADDFECTSPSLLTDVHFWGSWRKDFKGEIASIHLSIHSDDPVGVGGTDLDNRFSKPDKLLWARDFSPREFEESLYHTVPRPGEWWWDPESSELIPGGDTQVWRYDIRIKPDEAFLQRGTEENPTIYWLDISVKTDEGEFGWKTRQWPDHFMDDAVWDRGSELPRVWNELRYPKDHPYHELERNSIDMAFMLTFEEVSCEPGIDVEKKVFDPETGEWVDAITADVGDAVRFRITIHNDGTCCDLTDIVVVDRLSESLEYADNATVDGEPGEPAFIGITSVAWEFPDRVLEPCQTITIEFDAEVVECGIDENIVKVKAVCVDTGAVVTDKDTATVMAGKPKLEWTWNSTTVEPDYDQVMMAPVVADLNGDDTPDIIFSTFNHTWLAGGILRAISGDGSGEIFSVTDPDYRVQAGAEPAVADIDDDGLPEIMVSKNTNEVICFEHDGALKWVSSTTVGRRAIAVADLDQDGTPEIIAGRTVFNNDGTVRWTGTSGSSYASVVADLDLDGNPEVVTGSTAYRYDGTIYWTSSHGGMPAIGNFDSDPYPEIVVVGSNNVSLKEHDGTLKWGPVAMPGGGGNGPPVVADIDGDGELEIGVGGRLHYVTFETDGSIKWMADIIDTSSLSAGSSAFDFDSDGSCEIVYSDHHYHRIFKGSDGTVLFKTPGPSGTLIEQPIIADVDNDGHVEIVFAVNNYALPGNTGIEVYGNDECWQTARCIWNQHTYHITNINDDATVPVVETNNWDVFNNYRAQSPHSCGEVDVTTVNITPPSQDVYPGPFTVNVTVDPAESITGVQFDLSFNASLVSADSVIEGDLLSQDSASTFFSPGTIDNAAGTITGVAGAITTPGATVSTPGVFATIRMTAKSVEGTSPLDLSNVIVGDINGDPVSIMVNDGTVTITTCIGDVNGDGTVNVLDMIRVGQHWGETGTPGWIPEDVNRDGAINVLDMIVIGQHWGPCP